MLNPSVHFTSIIKEARSVVVAGGTMEPVNIPYPIVRDPRAQLCCVIRFQSSKISCFLQLELLMIELNISLAVSYQLTPPILITINNCYHAGHVIEKDNLICVSLPKGPSGIEFDFTFQKRNDLTMVAV